MPRGGYRKPENPASVSGPGKFSKRTDGKITEPDIDTAEGVQYGDRQMLADAQRIAKTAVGAGASVASPRALTGSPPTRGRLPLSVDQMGPDNNPAEPTTAGLGMGPGPGPEILDAGTPTDDERVVILEYIAEMYGNQDAVELLAQMRAESAAKTQEQMAAPALEGTELEALPE